MPLVSRPGPHAAGRPAFSLRFQDEVSLVPEDADDCSSSAPFLSLALSSLSLLGAQPEVKEADSNLESLNWYAERHAWKKAVRKAGEGPVALRELRAAVPHRRR